MSLSKANVNKSKGLTHMLHPAVFQSHHDALSPSNSRAPALKSSKCGTEQVVLNISNLNWF